MHWEMKNKILILANRDFVIYNFRFELLQRLINEEYEVYVCIPYGPKVESMKDIGCQYIPIEIDRRGTNPLKDIELIKTYKKIFNKIKPDLILSYTTKVDIYSGIVSSHLKIPYIINISGLGTAVEEKSFIQNITIKLYNKSTKNADCVFFQNEDNVKFFDDHKIKYRKKVLIPGSGVNLKKWSLLPYPEEKDGLDFLFIARIIKEKGIEQYLYAAKEVKKIFPTAKFHVLGPCDDEHYKKMLDDYKKSNIIIYHGMVQDTSEYLKFAHCTIHPSYYPEGISNVLLETCASGRPIITTDRPGCKEVVDDGVNGFMVKQQDKEDLVEKVIRFCNLTKEARIKMGLAAREKVEKEFDRNIVINAYDKEIHRILN